MSTGSKRFRRLLPAVLLPVALGAALLAWKGIYREAPEGWYPFIPALLSDHYTAGPLAMTSNTRESNPVWRELPAFNRMQARLAYAARRGEPAAQLAWLLPRAGWKDEPAFNLRGVVPNAAESPTSRALAEAGYEYDRISRNALASATAANGRLVVGQARYEALLVSELHSATPELLANIAALVRAGIAVVWLGGFPDRASGWADPARRDAAVREHVVALRERVHAITEDAQLAAAFAATGIRPALAPADGGAMHLRVHRRRVHGEELYLLFNESPAPVSAHCTLGTAAESATLLDPETGAGETLHVDNEGRGLEIRVPARRTRVLRIVGARQGAPIAASVADDSWSEATWREPPRALYPAVRWWWPGNAVNPDELRRELQSLHAAGFGTVEVQTLTLGLRRAVLQAQRERIYQVGTQAWFANLRTVFEEARRLGLDVDLTLGSGWSSGGPFITDHPERQLLAAWADVEGPRRVDIAIPAPAEPGYVRNTNRVVHGTIGAFDAGTQLEAVIATRIDDGTEPPTLDAPLDLGAHVAAGRIRWDVPGGRHRIFAFHRNATSHNAAGSAYPGALERSPILDHLDAGGAREYIAKLADPWLEAIAPFRPGAVFVDSFELIGELPWSPSFAAAFRTMHGYALEPWLPLVFRQDGESKYLEAFAPPAPAYRAADDRGTRIREDYEATRARLFIENFLRPMQDWSRLRGVQFRLQAHGGYGDYLDGYALADIPESEGLFAGGSFDFLKLASSAAHVGGRRVVSSESFITLGLDIGALDLEDYYLLAGNAFAAGINRTVCHGYAYHYLPP